VGTNLYGVRFYQKYEDEPPDHTWSNVLEGTSEEVLGFGVCETWALDIATGFQAIQYRAVQYSRCVFYTWIKDSKPYNPEVLCDIPLDGLSGSLDPGSDAYAHRELVVKIRKQAVNGKLGKLGVRGALLDTNVVVVNKVEVLDPADTSAFESRVDALQTSLITTLGDHGFQLSMIGAPQLSAGWALEGTPPKPKKHPTYGAPVARQVLALALAGIGEQKFKIADARFGRGSPS